MVLWISAQDKRILIATSRYFQSPFSAPLSDHSGLMPFNKERNDSSSNGKDDGSGKEKPTDKNKQVELNFLNSVAADFYRLLHLDENLDQKPVDVQVTSDGLKVTLFNRSKSPIFVGDTAEFSEWGRTLLQNLSWLIERHKFRVTIDGHTRRMAPPKRKDYTSWELSADRANAARRELVFYAVDPGQIERVTGYADTRPVEGESPESDANQRVSLSLTLTSKMRPTPAKTVQAGGGLNFASGKAAGAPDQASSP
jgi:chemotaxis protein MotB